MPSIRSLGDSTAASGLLLCVNAHAVVIHFVGSPPAVAVTTIDGVTFGPITGIDDIEFTGSQSVTAPGTIALISIALLAAGATGADAMALWL
ncbi:MAG: hypothetical protein KDI68_07590 [Gammaproteobacteria bacterium]|nr:hypothetical protein [Gammaproteobacteria bacterium]